VADLVPAASSTYPTMDIEDDDNPSFDVKEGSSLCMYNQSYVLKSIIMFIYVYFFLYLHDARVIKQ